MENLEFTGMLRRLRQMLEWVGSHGPGVLVALLVVVAGTWGFVELLDEVQEGDTRDADERIVRALVGFHGEKYRWLEEIGRDITALGGIAPLLLLSGMAAVYLLLVKKYGAMWLMVAAVGGGLMLSLVLKHVIDRPRPQIAERTLSHVYTQSFPSGHAMLATVVYLTLGTLLARLVKPRAIKAYFIGAALGLSFLVGVSRVYMGVHWPTDVLAGWTAGLVWAIGCWLVATWLQRKRVVEQEGELGAER